MLSSAQKHCHITYLNVDFYEDKDKQYLNTFL